jgi:shikimate dehydrogenase
VPESLEIRIGSHPVAYRGSTRTRVYGVIGHPVRHSLSPVFQSAAFRALGLDATYLMFDVEPGELAEAVRRMRQAAAAGVLAGLNVTIPHKRALLPHLDDQDDTSRWAGAVNTVCFDTTPTTSGGEVRLRGGNTDVDGLLDALQEAGVLLRQATVVVVGAGGMARAAVVAALRAQAAEIRVVARKVDQARAMLDTLAASWRGPLPRLAAAELRSGSREAVRGAQVLIQATPVGMAAGDPSPVDLAGASADLFVLDTIYNPAETALLAAARAAGLGAANGLGLLLHQGAWSFRMWTGQPAPLEIMRRSLG